MAYVPLRPLPPPAGDDSPPDRLDALVIEVRELLERLRTNPDSDVESSLEAAARRRRFRVIQGGAS